MTRGGLGLGLVKLGNKDGWEWGFWDRKWGIWGGDLGAFYDKSLGHRFISMPPINALGMRCLYNEHNYDTNSPTTSNS